jgi:hypothetical protein
MLISRHFQNISVFGEFLTLYEGVYTSVKYVTLLKISSV